MTADYAAATLPIYSRLKLLSFYGSHVVAEHCYRESPVDKSEGGEEACHKHVLYPSGFNKEETDSHHKDAVDEVEPPVFAVSLAYGTDNGADAPEQEYDCDKVGEYKF